MNQPKSIIDTHQHVNWHQRDVHGLIRDMDDHGIGQAWLLSWIMNPLYDNGKYHRTLNPANVLPTGLHEGIPLQDLINAKERYPERFLLGYCPNPIWPTAPDLLATAHQMHGVQVCGEWKFKMLIDDPRCIEIFKVAGEFKMPVILHLDVPYLRNVSGGCTYQTEWYGGTVENLARALVACPDTLFIGHAPGFWREISSDADKDSNQYPDTPVISPGKLEGLFRDNPNLYADLSANSALIALRRDVDHAGKFLTRHRERLLFGRDRYGRDLHEFLGSLSLDEETIERIYHTNAESLVAHSH